MSQDVITAAAQEGVEPLDVTPPTFDNQTKPKKVIQTRGFGTLKLDELKNVAAEFGVDVPEGASKPLIVGALADEGVTFDQYVMFRDADKEEPEEVEPIEDFVEAPIKRVRKATENDVLVKMDRMNYTFEVRGHKFTKEHPFVVMSADEAQEIFDSVPGFRIATPREASEYYS